MPIGHRNVLTLRMHSVTYVASKIAPHFAMRGLGCWHMHQLLVNRLLSEFKALTKREECYRVTHRTSSKV